MKTCLGCSRTKDSTEFYKDKSRKDGFSYNCKMCQRRQAKKWAKAHPDNRRQIMREWKARTDIQAHNRKIWIKRTYDKTIEDIERLFAAQNGRCAICKRPLIKYHIDHDHGSMVVRGLLCRSCNVGLGFFQDSIKRLNAAVQYLKAIQ